MSTAISQAGEINGLHESLSGLARKSLETAIEIGRLLTEQKATLKHGEWLPWCADNLTFGKSTMAKYLMLYRDNSKIPATGNLGIEDAYRLLTKPAEPEPEPEQEEEPEAEEPEPFDSPKPDEDRPYDDEVEEEEEEAEEVPVEVVDGRAPVDEGEDEDPYRPSQAMEFAIMAIAQLERINHLDFYRRDAFQKVIRYCEKHIK